MEDQPLLRDIKSLDLQIGSSVIKHLSIEQLFLNGVTLFAWTMAGQEARAQVSNVRDSTPHTELAATSLVVKQIELRLTANEIQQLINGRLVVLRIAALTGAIEKTLTGDEIERIRRFVVGVEPILLAVIDRSVVSITLHARERLYMPWAMRACLRSPCSTTS